MQWKFCKIFYHLLYGYIFCSKKLDNTIFLIDLPHPMIAVNKPVAKSRSMGEQVPYSYLLFGWSCGKRTILFIKALQYVHIGKLRNIFRDRVIKFKLCLFPSDHYRCRG